ncbi:MAG: ribonuclease H family protein [Meiothermus silvanus]|nr:ribonuclease H family protein [Allomeiothermus silvanus]
MSKRKWYAVARGRRPGLYRTWSEAEAQLRGYPGGLHRSFCDRAEAEEWLRSHRAPAEAPTADWIIYTDGSLKHESATASAVALHGGQVVAQGQIGLPPVGDVGEAEGRGLLLALLLAPGGSRIEIHTDRADFAGLWAEGKTDRLGILEAVRALAKARKIGLEIRKVPRKEVDQAHQQATQAHQERSRQRDLGRTVGTALEDFPERYRMAVIRLVESFLQSKEPRTAFADWVGRKDSPTRRLLVEWCRHNRAEELLRAVEGLNPALSKALQDRDREAVWSQLPPTERQLAYLKGLGYSGPLPKSLLEASRLIESLKG